MPYTGQDTPEIIARIRSDLDDIVSVVRHGDPWLRSLVLTGGFARGEGTVLAGQPQNDYDLVAIRSLVPPNRSYDDMRAELEQRLGMHIDLAPIAALRLRFASRSIFWYETALRGQVIWGDDLLRRVPVRRASDLDPDEGLRLLVNRAAGLLLSVDAPAAEKRIQASKALLGALDVHLLAAGQFPPSHRERWDSWQQLLATGRAPRHLATLQAWLSWAYRSKTAPDSVPERSADQAWRVAARAVHGAVPLALRHAGLTTLDDYEKHDGLTDRFHYMRHADEVSGGDARARHPTGQVRVATLHLLERSLNGRISAEAAHLLDDVAGHRNVETAGGPVQVLEELRGATLQ